MLVYAHSSASKPQNVTKFVSDTVDACPMLPDKIDEIRVTDIAYHNAVATALTGVTCSFFLCGNANLFLRALDGSVVEALRVTWSRTENRRGASIMKLRMTTQNNCSTVGTESAPPSLSASTRRGIPTSPLASRLLKRPSPHHASFRSMQRLSRRRLRSSLKAESLRSGMYDGVYHDEGECLTVRVPDGDDRHAGLKTLHHWDGPGPRHLF